ncbi:MAG TPA: Ig-like domain-containing protein [Candidatus Paceibacterota bacterium]|nr:Ig-like domain-containing protein [Candidatus Paceibacterota bacterium]
MLKKIISGKKSLIFYLFLAFILPLTSNALISFPTKIDTLEERINIQVVLNRVLNPSPNLVVDGVIGKKTIQAIQSFQEGKGLVPDGKVGPITRSALESSQAGITTITPTTTPTNTPSNTITNNGCISGGLYNVYTGKSCSVVPSLPSGCTTSTLFSPITGQKCNNTTVAPIVKKSGGGGGGGGSSSSSSPTCSGSTSQSCSISNGTGSQTRTCTNGVWSSYNMCTVSSCDTGYEISGNACSALTCSGSATQSCAITNGTGTQTRTCNLGSWSSYGSCTVSSCDNGYSISGNTCVQDTPVVSTQIIADHTIVDRYDDIPEVYLNEVKKKLVWFPGESHSAAYRQGLLDLEAINPTYDSTTQWGFPAHVDDAHLRSAGLVSGLGEEEWFTWKAYDIGSMPAERTFLTDYLDAQFNANNPVDVVGFAWCWDMSFQGPTSGVDPVTGNHWYGETVGGPNGNLPWGLNSADSAITNNSVSMDTYLAATEDYINYVDTNNYGTKVVFTTGPVDNYSASGEAGYQAYLKNEYIRNYVENDSTRILFDYADILSYDDNNSLTTATWNGHVYPVITATNLGAGDIGHISSAGAVRLAKAQWWLMARIAGWDGGDVVTVPVTSITLSAAGNATTITQDDGTLQMSATVLPANATDKTVVWSVINGTGQATINSSTGLVTAVSDGTVTVRATANDGSAVYGEYALTLSGQLNLAPSFLTTDGLTEGWWVAESDNITMGTGVSSLADSSTNNRNLTENRASNQPSFSNNTITFDGNDQLDVGMTLSQPFTIYEVIRIDANSYFRTISGFYPALDLKVGNGAGILNIITNGNTRSYTSSFTDNEWVIVKIVVDGANTFIQTDNNTPSSTVDAGVGSLSHIYQGNEEFTGSFKEMIIRGANESAENEQAIMDYLNSKYSAY